MLNNKLLDELSSEEQVIVMAVNQLPKHPENEASRPDTSDALALLTAEKLQVGGSVYPYFSAPAGPAGENLEVWSYKCIYIYLRIPFQELSNESSELHVQVC